MLPLQPAGMGKKSWLHLWKYSLPQLRLDVLDIQLLQWCFAHCSQLGWCGSQIVLILIVKIVIIGKIQKKKVCA